jgi:hypothetical protein
MSFKFKFKWNIGLVVLAICAGFFAYLYSGAAGAQEEIIPVPKSQLVQMLQEHQAALMLLDELQRANAALRAKLACV